MIPLIPLLAGLNAIGALTGGVVGIAKTEHNDKMLKKHLEETKIHNIATEKFPLGKGLYLNPKNLAMVNFCTIL